MAKLKIALKMSILLPTIFIVGCARNPASAQAEQCRTLLDAGYAELEKAKADHFSGAADIMTATNLLSTAAIQRQFSKYSSCINKAERARALLKPYLK